jgi:hypothetical protein
MRLRAAIALLIVALFLLVAGPAAAADGYLLDHSNILLAQDPGEDPGEANVGEEEEAQQTGGEEEGGGGAAEESGAGEGETEGGTGETGPPWTYQMARAALALTVLLGLGIALMYRRLVGSRQRV